MKKNILGIRKQIKSKLQFGFNAKCFDFVLCGSWHLTRAEHRSEIGSGSGKVCQNAGLKIVMQSVVRRDVPVLLHLSSGGKTDQVLFDVYKVEKSIFNLFTSHIVQRI